MMTIPVLVRLVSYLSLFLSLSRMDLLSMCLDVHVPSILIIGDN